MEKRIFQIAVLKVNYGDIRLCFGNAAHLLLKQDKQWASWIRSVSTGAKNHNDIGWNTEVAIPQLLELDCPVIAYRTQFSTADLFCFSSPQNSI